MTSTVRKSVALTITLFSALFVLSLTLFPFRFHWGGHSAGIHQLALGLGVSGAFDVVENVLLFIPLGFGLSGLFPTQGKRRPSLGAVCLLCFAFSYAIEVLQQFSASRFPSLIDVLANGLGGLLGAQAHGLWRMRAFSRRALAVFALVHLCGFTLFSAVLQRRSLLTNWYEGFPLLVGNELTGDRPWKGRVHEIYLANRALSKQEIAQAATRGELPGVAPEALVARYVFTGSAPYRDLTGNLPDLIWAGESLEQCERDTMSGASISPSRWLRTSSSAAALVKRVAKESHFTLGATFTVGSTDQYGPARIVSFSGDTAYRNFTLGQQGSALVFRLRTPMTTESGASPELVVPGVFTSESLQHVVVTYDGAVLRTYVDGSLKARLLRLGPGAAGFIELYSRSEAGLRAANTLYYVLVFVPIGILLLLALEGLKGRWAQFLLVVGSLGPAAAIEGVLVGVTGKSFELRNLLSGFLPAIVPVALYAVATLGSAMPRGGMKNSAGD